MTLIRSCTASLAAALLATAAASAHAEIIISEVSPYSSGNAPYGADWFELTNTATAPVAVSGWKVDDNSNSFASAVLLNAIAEIGAGELVIFIDGSAATAAAFKTFWFGAHVPGGLQVGTYSGAGIGLSTGGDALNIFASDGTRLAGASFGPSTTGRTFDNAAGRTSLTLPLPEITTLSSLGTNGAFQSVAALASGVPVGTLDIGSPGTIAAVPEASTYAMLMIGLAGLSMLRRVRR